MLSTQDVFNRHHLRHLEYLNANYAKWRSCFRNIQENVCFPSSEPSWAKWLCQGVKELKSGIQGVSKKISSSSVIYIHLLDFTIISTVKEFNREILSIYFGKAETERYFFKFSYVPQWKEVCEYSMKKSLYFNERKEILTHLSIINAAIE